MKKDISGLVRRRRILKKELETINEQIDRAENEKLIIKGQIGRSSVLDIKQTSVYSLERSVTEFLKLNVEVYRYKNEIRCVLTSDGVLIPADVKFEGVAKCSKDDKFVLTTGLNLAQKRAEKALDAYMEQMIQDRNSAYYMSL